MMGPLGSTKISDYDLYLHIGYIVRGVEMRYIFMWSLRDDACPLQICSINDYQNHITTMILFLRNAKNISYLKFSYHIFASIKALLWAITAFVILVIFLSSAPAKAQQIENAQSFDMTVTGYIAEHCAIGSIADMDFGNLERRGLNRQTSVDLDCNIPFNMTVTSASGALTHTTMPNGQGDFSGKVPYALSIEMPVRHPATQIINASFNSNQLQSGGVVSSNGGIAIDGFILGVELGQSSGRAGLLAGEYSESITITISPI